MLHPIQLRSIIRADTTQVNKPNNPYRFENIFQYHYGILQKSNIEIRYKLQYRFKMVLLVWRMLLLFSLNLNISKFSISQLNKKHLWNEYIEYIEFGLKYCNGFEIPTPLSPKLNQSAEM